MKKALKFMIPVLGNAALLVADNGGDCCPQPKQECKTTCKEVCAPCPTKKVCKTTCCEWRPKPPCECVTRVCDCGVDFFITADFIYWRAREDGLEYAMLNNSTLATATPAQGSVNREKTKWKPGFKVGVGFDFCDWGWDTYFNYTWYRTTHHHTSSTSTAGGGLALYDTYWYAQNLTGVTDTTTALITYTSATENWNLHLNVLDWEMGRKFWIGKHIMLRPQFGLKGVWNKQNQSASFTGTFVGAGVTNTTNNHEKFHGIGIRAGLDTAFYFTRGFSLVGKFALTGLYERFKVTRQDFTTTAAGVTTSFINLQDKFWNVEPVLEWFIGLNWETWWSCDNYHFAIWAGWEEQWWADQARFIRMPGSAQHGAGDLAFQGLTLGVMFEF